jgi:hypothetical protein
MPKLKGAYKRRIPAVLKSPTKTESIKKKKKLVSIKKNKDKKQNKNKNEEILPPPS